MRILDADELLSMVNSKKGSVGCAGLRNYIKVEAIDRDDLVERKKGHWVENHDSDHAWKCSECGCGYTDSKLNFCYDCGADMREQET